MCMHAHTIPQIQLLITRLHVQSITIKPDLLCYNVVVCNVRTVTSGVPMQCVLLYIWMVSQIGNWFYIESYNNVFHC